MKLHNGTTVLALAALILAWRTASAANYEVIPFRSYPKDTYLERESYRQEVIILDNTKGKMFVCVLDVIPASESPNKKLLAPEMRYRLDEVSHTSALNHPADLTSSLFSPHQNSDDEYATTLWQIDPVNGDLQACLFNSAAGVSHDCIRIYYPH
jgi:hypothetical protein